MAIIHKVQQGECLSSIAKKHGFPDWRIIYNDQENAEFRRKRPNPNLIYPGDKIYIPDKKLKEESCTTENKHRVKVRTPKTILRLLIQDKKGQPFSGKRYRLKVKNVEDSFLGDIDDNGLINQEIPTDAEEGELTIWPDDDPSRQGYTWILKIGHLDPVEEITGIQARLNNLGFYDGPVDGALNPETEKALKAFQEKVGLEPTGKVDDEKARDRLVQEHDRIHSGEKNG